jgi:hypothetical protein
MNKSIAIATIVALATLSVVYFQNHNQNDAFAGWKQTFGTPFEASEEVYRRFIFEKNLEKI